MSLDNVGEAREAALHFGQVAVCVAIYHVSFDFTPYVTLGTLKAKLCDLTWCDVQSEGWSIEWK